MGKVQIPIWLEPKEIQIRYEKVTHLKDTKEVMVHIRVNGEEYAVFIPHGIGFVLDSENKTIKAWLVAKFEDDLLVDLPVETLTSGQRIRIPKDHIDEVVFAE